MDRFHNPYRSLARCSFLAVTLAVAGLAAGVGQAQVVSRTKGVQKKTETPKLNQTANPGAAAVGKLPTDRVLSVGISQFYARRDDDNADGRDDKIRIVGIVANSDKEPTPPVSYLIYRWTGKAWDVIKSGKLIAPLKPQEQGAIIHDMRIDSDAMRFDAMKFKVDVSAGRKLLAEYQLKAKEKTFVVRFSTENRWIKATMFFVSDDRHKLKGEKARAYAKNLAAFAGPGLNAKTEMYRSDNPFERDYDTVKCHTTSWVDRTFASQAAADAFERSLRGLILIDTIKIEREVR